MQTAHGAPGIIVFGPPPASIFASSGRLPIAGRAFASYGTSIVISRRNAPSPSNTWMRRGGRVPRSEEHTSELQSLAYLVCRLLLEKKKKKTRESCVSTY